MNEKQDSVGQDGKSLVDVSTNEGCLLDVSNNCPVVYVTILLTVAAPEYVRMTPDNNHEEDISEQMVGTYTLGSSVAFSCVSGRGKPATTVSWSFGVEDLEGETTAEENMLDHVRESIDSQSSTTDAIDTLTSHLTTGLASLEGRLKSSGTGNRDGLLLIAESVLSSINALEGQLQSTCTNLVRSVSSLEKELEQTGENLGSKLDDGMEKEAAWHTLSGCKTGEQSLSTVHIQEEDPGGCFNKADRNREYSGEKRDKSFAAKYNQHLKEGRA